MRWLRSSTTSACLLFAHLSYSTSAPVGSSDADIQVQLKRDHHPSEMYVGRLREVLARDYPGRDVLVVPVDIVTQILNFGLSSPIDIQIVGPNLYANRPWPNACSMRSATFAERPTRASSSLSTTPFHGQRRPRRAPRAPALLSQNVAQGMLVALSGSFQTSPNFFLDPAMESPTTSRFRRRSNRSTRMAAFESLPSPVRQPTRP